MIRQAVARDEPAIRDCAEQAYARYVSLIGRKPAPMVADFAAQIADGNIHVATGEDGAFQGLLAAPLPRESLYLGKVLSNIVLLATVTLVTVLVFALFYQVVLPRNPLPLAGVLLLGVTGFSALGTLFSGITAGTRMGETLLPVLLFPLLVPVVMFGASATATLLAGFPPSEVAGQVRVLGAFTLVALTAGVALFRFIVEE